MATAVATRRKVWTDRPHQTVPADLATELRTLRAERGNGRLGAALTACRDAEWGVPALAAATGMTCSAVAQQIHRARRAGNTTAEWLTIPAPDLPADAHPARFHSGGPNPPLPPGCGDHLRALAAQAYLVRGGMPPFHPYRLAAQHLADDIALLLARGFRKARITAVLAVSYRAIDQRLERHGHRPPAASVTRPGYVLPHHSS